MSSKAVDVASVLYETVAGWETPASWPAHAVWPYHGVPGNLVFTEVAQPRGPVCAPETIVIDHGKAFLSAHVISVCARRGISIQPAQTGKPTDKPTIERFFRTLRTGLIQHLAAYTGPDIHSRGEKVEQQAFYFLHELEEIIRRWIAEVYHVRKHRGLVIPQWPGQALSPVEMWHAGIARSGVMRFPASPHLALEFLPVYPRTIQHYGVEVDGLRYNGRFLAGRANERSPYGGQLDGRWPIHRNDDDVRMCWIQDPADSSWHRLDWEHRPALDTPFCRDSAAYARRLASASHGNFNARDALKRLLDDFDHGIVANRVERRIAARRSAENRAFEIGEAELTRTDDEPLHPRNALTIPSELTPADAAISGDDDDDTDFADDYDGEGGYEVLE